MSDSPIRSTAQWPGVRGKGDYRIRRTARSCSSATAGTTPSTSRRSSRSASACPTRRSATTTCDVTPTASGAVAALHRHQHGQPRRRRSRAALSVEPGGRARATQAAQGIRQGDAASRSDEDRDAGTRQTCVLLLGHSDALMAGRARLLHGARRRLVVSCCHCRARSPAAPRAADPQSRLIVGLSTISRGLATAS